MKKEPFRTIRWQNWDYGSNGTYSVTICTAGRRCLLGETVNGQVHLSAAGEIVREEWFRSTEIRSELLLDEMIVMPNHMHAIVGIRKESAGVNDAEIPRRNSRERAPRSLSTFLGSFKAVTTRRIRECHRDKLLQVWQDRYHDRVIRNEQELNLTRAYIVNNPANWDQDEENPSRETP